MRLRELRNVLRAMLVAASLAAASAPLAQTSLVGALDPNNAQDVLLHVFTLSAPGSVSIQSWG